MRTVLLTGFEPFGGENINPSWEIARYLDGQQIAGHLIHARLLPCIFGTSLARRSGAHISKLYSSAS